MTHSNIIYRSISFITAISVIKVISVIAVVAGGRTYWNSHNTCKYQRMCERLTVKIVRCDDKDIDVSEQCSVEFLADISGIYPTGW